MINLPKKWTEELAEETGWHVGDGSMNVYCGKGLYQLRGHIKDDKAHYIQRIKPIFNKLYDISVPLREMSSDGVFGFQIWNDQLVDFKNKLLGLPLGKKTDYQIPLEIIKNPKLKLAFLRGIFDTDGCVYLENKRGKLYPRIEIKLACDKLSAKIVEICLSAGIRATRYVWKRKEKNWSTMYCISIRGKEMADKWMKTVQPKNQKHIFKWNKFLKNQVKSCSSP